MVAEAIRRFAEGDADSVVSVTRGRHKLGTIQGGHFVPRYQTGIRSQDMAPEYYENGVIYVSSARMVVEREDLFGVRMVPLITDELYALGDIDTELDFRVAEFLFHAYRAKFEEENAPEDEVSSGRQRGGNSWTSFE
jgi:N-acylneuraminate cytidylyltransferase